MEPLNFQSEEAEKSLLFLTRSELGNQNNFFQFLTDGDFLKVLNSTTTKEILNQIEKANKQETNVEENLQKALDVWLNSGNSVERQSQLLCVGIAALLSFIQDNWCGPSLESGYDSLEWLCSCFHGVQSGEGFQEVCFSNLVLDGESIVSVTRHPEFLILARAVFLAEFPDLQSALWWRFRCFLIHQQVLEEKSPILHDQLVSLGDKLQQSDLIKYDTDLKVLLHLEIAQMHLMYHEVLPSNQALETAVNGAGIRLNLTGALGKRTRFQVRDLAQLTLDVHADEQSAPTYCVRNDLPKDVRLNDDVRLDKIAFINSGHGEHAALTPLQQACVLGTYVQTQKCQPKDKLADEELMAYLTCLLSQPQVWSFQLSSLLFRCKIESNHSRTVERSMTQAQALVDSVNLNSPGAWHRLPLIFCSHMSPRWCLEEELANLLISLGCVNSALDIYLRLHCWEQVIACYNHLKLRHKAEEIIRQELEKKETVKLWCLLGDATDNVEFYEKAWILSNEKSARAQRHWGLYFFHRKQYGEAIPHMQESLSHNSLQTTLWFQLGYASLQFEDWTTAANAYRRCCTLDPENFEAWNNLSKAYVKLGQKNRAWKSLQEALKWDYENWRVWENFLVVSLDCAVMDEVIRAYHRILDLKGKHVDTEVLEILGKAIIENLPDCDGMPCGVLLEKTLELLGRITAQVQNNWKVWRLYSRLASVLPSPSPEDEFRAVQHLQKAHRSAVAVASWVNDNASCLEVMDLSEDLANVSLDFAGKTSNNIQASSVLSSAKLSLKSTLTKLKQQHLNILTGQIEDELLSKYTELDSLLDKIVQASSVNKSS